MGPPSPSPTPPSPSPAPPSPSPAPPSPSPVPGQVCEDKDVHCPTSYAQYCQHESAQTREHIQNTCPLTCGLCTAETPSPAPPSPSPVPGRVCEDKDVHCPTSYEQYCQHESAQ